MTPNLYKQVIKFLTYLKFLPFTIRNHFLGFLGQISGEELDPRLWAVGFSVPVFMF